MHTGVKRTCQDHRAVLDRIVGLVRKLERAAQANPKRIGDGRNSTPAELSAEIDAVFADAQGRDTIPLAECHHLLDALGHSLVRQTVSGEWPTDLELFRLPTPMRRRALNEWRNACQVMSAAHERYVKALARRKEAKA